MEKKLELNNAFINAGYQKKLLSHLEKDECEQFFKCWNELFGDGEFVSKSAEIISLEFNIHLYFVTFPLRESPPNKEEYRKRIDGLKKLFDNQGGIKYSTDVQLVQYFALPYVVEPEKHPVFRELIEKKWAKSVCENLSAFLANYATNLDERRNVLLQKWMTAYRLQYNELLEKKCRKLQYDYCRIVDIVNEMFDYLEQSKHEVGVIHLSSEYIVEMKARFADATANADQYMQTTIAIHEMDKKHNRHRKTNINMRKKNNRMTNNDESVGNLITTIRSSSSSSTSLIKLKEEKEEEEIIVDDVIGRLNYTKIGNCLIKSASGRLSCLLLQALRQRITRVPIESAGQVLAVYANNDLLLLKHLKNSVVNVIISQGDDGNDAKEELCRLLNSIASFNCGRNYLLANNQGKELIATLTAALKTKKLHHYAGEHVLAALQKLSIRSSVQKELIKLGMVEWLSLYLGGKLSPTALDYGCALLLNLCLDQSGRSAASRVAAIFTTTIANLISDHKLQVCTYINGILFTILGIAQIKARVKEINLVNTVKEKLNNHHCKDDEKQLPIIYKILNGGQNYLFVPEVFIIYHQLITSNKLCPYTELFAHTGRIYHQLIANNKVCPHIEIIRSHRKDLSLTIN
ncbi:LisH domain-containing protein [Dirofilaria immitis]